MMFWKEKQRIKMADGPEKSWSKLSTRMVRGLKTVTMLLTLWKVRLPETLQINL